MKVTFSSTSLLKTPPFTYSNYIYSSHLAAMPEKRPLDTTDNDTVDENATSVADGEPTVYEPTVVSAATVLLADDATSMSTELPQAGTTWLNILGVL